MQCSDRPQNWNRCNICRVPIRNDYTRRKNDINTGKKITLFILLGVKASVGWEWQTVTGKRIKTAILTNNYLFSRPYHAIISSWPHSTLLLFSWEVLNWRPSVGRFVGRCSGALRDWSNLFWLQAETDLKLRLTQNSDCLYLTWAYTYHFSTPTYFRSTTWLLHLFLHVHPLQIISDWWLDQGSICNSYIF